MLSEKSKKALKEIFGERAVILDPAELIVYEVDAAQDRGKPDGIVFPGSLEQLCRLALWAAENRVPLVSRGSGTGLSGGAVAEQGGLIVEFSRLNASPEVDESGPAVRVEPGVITQRLDDLTRALGLYYPPDPSSGRSSSLGGNVAENAGGPHCFKYGVTTNYITGMDVVLADGMAVSLGGGAFDYPEYDFTGLFCGSEGTLGMIARIRASLLRQPAGIKTLMGAFKSIEEASRAVSAVITAGLVPATIELMDQKIIQIVEDFVHPGLPGDAGGILIVDVDGYPAGLDGQLDEIAAICKSCGGYELRIARDAAERERIWYGRKSAVGALARLAPAYLLLDGTIPRSHLAEVIAATNEMMDARGLKVGYVAHAGDGNLHPMILMHPEDPEQIRRVWQAGQAFMERVTAEGGSITGEHGVGIEKRGYLSLMYSPVELKAMLEVKRVFDPQALMNPGKIFPEIKEPAALENGAPAVPSGEWTPGTAGEAAAGMAALQRAGRPAWISSAGGAASGERTEGGVILRTAGLNQLKQLSTEDLYVTAGAGMRLLDLQNSLAAHGAWIPISSPWPDASLGGILAANLNAPMRTRYGGIRDQVLAMTVVLPDGRVLKLGRPVVKNVAGYDLAKLFIGAQGTLGLISEVTFKFTALPRARKSLVFACPSLEAALDLLRLCKRHTRVASGVVISPNPGGLQQAGQPFILTYTAEGLAEDVRSELELVAQDARAEAGLAAQESQSKSGCDLWQELLGSAREGLFHYRCAVPPGALAGFVLKQQQAFTGGDFLVDGLSGFVYAAVDAQQNPGAVRAVEALRGAAVAAGGYLVLLDKAPALKDARGFEPESLPYMRKLKDMWDPKGVLNRGSFLA